MANTAIRLKSSGASGNVPSTLELGELAINYADGRLYYKNSLGVITYITSGVPTDSFSTINVDSTLILATSNTDILSFSSANGIIVSADAGTKTITIDANISDSVDSTNSQQIASSNSVNTVYTLAQAAYTKANTTGSYTITGAQYVDYGYIGQTPGPVLFDYGTL